MRHHWAKSPWEWRGNSARSDSERGAVLVFVSFSLVALLGMAALALDAGQLYWVRRELQNTADAAVLAAAELLPSTGSARSAALQYADLNRPGSLAGSDIVFGNWDPDSSTFTPNGSPTNAVEVTTRETVDNFFARILGVNTSDVTAVAIAMQANSIIDFEGPLPGFQPTTLSTGDGISGPPVPGTVTISGSRHGPMYFDGTCRGGPRSRCTGGDTDLYQPTQGNILILSEDGDSNDPDDDGRGGWFELDFSGFGAGYVTVGSLVLIDAEEDGLVTLYRDGVVVNQAVLGGVADGTMEYRFVSAVSGVDFIRIEMSGSGAIDDIGYQSVSFLVR